MNKTNYIFFSKNNLLLGDRIRRVIKKTDNELFYYNDLGKTVDFLTSSKNTLVFVEKTFSKYIKVVAGLMSSNLFHETAIVFIDDSDEIKSYVNNKNIYAVSENIDENEIFDVINKFVFRTELGDDLDLKQVKSITSKILMDLGVSIKHIGFMYMKDCIEYIAKKHFKLFGLHGDVYKHVACLNGTNECNVERSIRNCIMQAKRIEGTIIHEMSQKFNYEITNKTFLGYVIERVQQEYDKVV